MSTSSQVTKFGHAMNQHFLFDPKHKNLNHGISINDLPSDVADVFDNQSLTSLLKAPSERILPLFELFSTSFKPLPKLDPTSSTFIPTHLYSTWLEPLLRSS
jgi:hypothetical protein